MSRLFDTLRDVAERLRASQVPFALIGGLAASVRTEPRFTRDVDLCVAVADDAEAIRVVRALGMRVITQIEHEPTGRLATVRLVDPLDDSAPVVDLLFASSGIEAEIIAGAEELEVVRGLRSPVASVAHLIALKVLSRDDVTRPQDRVDLVRLLERATEDQIAEARRALALIHERGFSRNRDLLAQLNRLLEAD